MRGGKEKGEERGEGGSFPQKSTGFSTRGLTIQFFGLYSPVWLIYLTCFVNFLLTLSIGALLWRWHTLSVKRPDLEPLLEKSARMLSSDSERRLKALETDWDDYYQKFSRLAGRFDRNRALAPSPVPVREDTPPPILTHTDVMRRWRNK